MDIVKRIFITGVSHVCGEKRQHCIVQNMAQLKAMYKDDWESLVGLCDEFLYLGGTEKETHKYVSELLGKETISTTSYNQSKGRSGSYSINHQQSGRDMPYLFVKSSVALNLL